MPSLPNRLPLPWKQGEHVAIIGQTGSGKTRLTAALVRQREYVVVLKTKRDREDAVYWRGFHVITKASSMDDQRYNRFLLRPRYERQAREGWDMLERGWKQGGWTLVIDENWYAEKSLGLRRQIEKVLTQGRSGFTTIVVGMQRPVDISRFGLSQATHVFSFIGDSRDAKTIAEATTDNVREHITSLSKFEFAYWNQKERIISRGFEQQLARIIRPPRRAA